MAPAVWTMTPMIFWATGTCTVSRGDILARKADISFIRIDRPLRKQNKLFFGNEGSLTKREPTPEVSELDRALSRIEEIERQTLDNLNSKVRSGKSLSPSELKALEKLQSRLETRKHADTQPKIVSRARDVGKYFDRSVRTIRYWLGKGAPRGVNGYNLEEIEKWAIKQGLLKGTVHDSDDPDHKDKLELEKELLRKNIELKEHRLQIQRGEYISRSEVDLQFAGKLGILINRLHFMVEEHAFEWIQLVGGAEESKALLVKAINGHVDKALNEMAEGVFSVTFGPKPPTEQSERFYNELQKN